MLELLLLGGNGCCLSLRAVPEDLIGCPYAELVEALYKRYRASPLGLMRACADYEGADAPPAVVLTNPPASMRVEPSDRVFVLAEAAAWEMPPVA